MAIQSIDNLIAAISAGQSYRYDWQKIFGGSNGAAGRAYDFQGLNGAPVANAFPGTPLTFVECDESTGNGTQVFGIPHGGNVSALVKHVLNMGAITTAATGVPGTLLLVDVEGYWPSISNNTLSAQPLSGTPSLRATNGAGTRLYYVQTTTTGASAQNLTLSYTDQSGNPGAALGATVAMTASTIASHINGTGTAANNYTPFLPLASGDTGVRNVASVTFTTNANTGTGALVLCKPIIEIPLGVASLYHNKDCLGQIPSLPRITDGACLSWIFIAGAALAGNTTFSGHLEFVHG